MPKTYITAYHDPNPIYFSLTESEMEQLCAKSKVPEKENCLFLLGLLIPATINMIVGWPAKSAGISASFVINSLITILSFILVFLQGIRWLPKRGQFDNYISDMKKKPQIQMVLVPSGDYLVSHSH